MGYGIRVFDATTRNVKCLVARIQIQRTITGRSGRDRLDVLESPLLILLPSVLEADCMRMTCRVRRYPGPSWDTRCTRGNRVVDVKFYFERGERS